MSRCGGLRNNVITQCCHYCFPQPVQDLLIPPQEKRRLCWIYSCLPPVQFHLNNGTFHSMPLVKSHPSSPKTGMVCMSSSMVREMCPVPPLNPRTAELTGPSVSWLLVFSCLWTGFRRNLMSLQTLDVMLCIIFLHADRFSPWRTINVGAFTVKSGCKKKH